MSGRVESNGNSFFSPLSFTSSSLEGDATLGHRAFRSTSSCLAVDAESCFAITSPGRFPLASTASMSAEASIRILTVSRDPPGRGAMESGGAVGGAAEIDVY
ncbi:hypothetical protein HPP92_006496 [Vanilla planifolia]|uniref:Uncharacterized protein n=1 Tax=Vanilla planifolia TaxID=51239 RepID=A0A835RNZ2_VANPL|nr:hypothetical protein HPP92_006496 [Vanilla planifolia]